MTFDPLAHQAPHHAHSDQRDTDEAHEDVLVLQEAPDPDTVLPVWEPTGNVGVDAALEELHAIPGADLGEHSAIYDRIQQSLRSTLDGLAAEDESA